MPNLLDENIDIIINMIKRISTNFIRIIHNWSSYYNQPTLVGWYWYLLLRLGPSNSFLQITVVEHRLACTPVQIRQYPHFYHPTKMKSSFTIQNLFWLLINRLRLLPVLFKAYHTFFLSTVTRMMSSRRFEQSLLVTNVVAPNAGLSKNGYKV